LIEKFQAGEAVQSSPAVPPSLVFENAESSSVRQKDDEKKKALEPRESKPVRESISV
jgi:hypothetical protein